jgi:hypothetical protein
MRERPETVDLGSFAAIPLRTGGAILVCKMVNYKNSPFCRKNRGRRNKIDEIFPNDLDKKSEAIQLVGGLGSGNWYRFGTKDAVEEYCALDVRKLNR